MCPICDYQCKQCGKTTEFVIAKWNDLPIKCECGCEELERVYSGGNHTVVYNYPDCTLKQSRFGE